MKYFSHLLALALTAFLNGCSTLPKAYQCAVIDDTKSSISQVIEFDSGSYQFAFDLDFKLRSPDDLRDLATALDVAHERAITPPNTNIANVRTDFRFPLLLRVINLADGSNKAVYEKSWGQLMYLGAGDNSVFMTIDRIWLDPGKYRVDLTFLEGARLPRASNQVCLDIGLPGKH